MNRINEHAGDKWARGFLRSLGTALGIFLVVAFVFGAVFGGCLLCQAMVVETGRQILRP